MSYLRGYFGKLVSYFGIFLIFRAIFVNSSGSLVLGLIFVVLGFLIYYPIPQIIEKIIEILDGRKLKKEEERKKIAAQKAHYIRKKEEDKLKMATGESNLRSYLTEIRTNVRLLGDKDEDQRKNNILLMEIDNTIDNILADELITEKFLKSTTMIDELSDIIDSLSEKGFNNDPAVIRFKKRLLFLN